MRIAALTLTLATLALCSCATTSQRATTEVDAVVIDEAARQKAVEVAHETAKSSDALKAADDVSTREPATRPQ